MLHGNRFGKLCGSLNVLADFVTVGRSIKKRSQDQHVECSLKKIRALRRLLLHGRRSTPALTEGRHSTIGSQEPFEPHSGSHSSSPKSNTAAAVTKARKVVLHVNRLVIQARLWVVP